ncbi:hypothetical protein COBT_002669 [Conglomerata obtusa]
MYIFTGLPIDTHLNTPDILALIRNHLPCTECIQIPSFPFEHLDSLLTVGDTLISLDTHATSSLKTYFSYFNKEVLINAQTIDYSIKTFQWSHIKYEPQCLSTLLDKITKDYNNFKEVMGNRITLYEKALKTCDKASKELLGALRDINIEMEEHDFIVEHYVIVPKGRIEEFQNTIKTIEKICPETLEKSMSEKENVLFKVMGIKSAKDEVKKKIIEKGFLYKQALSKVGFEERKNENERIIAESDVIKNNFFIYLNTNVSEMFSIFMHIKVLKLYVECVLLYGIDKCVYFVSFGKKRKLICEWKKIVSEWRFSKRIDKNIKNENTYAYVFVNDFTKEEIEE